MLDNIFSSSLSYALSKLNYLGLQEIRLRANKPVTVSYYGKYYFLGDDGLSSSKQDALVLNNEDLENIIFKASNYSVYAVNEDIKKGFLTLNNGVRIGIVGQVVSENDKVITVKNFSALNIRFPHEIKGVSNKIIDKLIADDEFLNTLIISPPGAGKTTLLRDIIRQISGIRLTKNVLVIDERNELSGFNNGECQLDIGYFSDVIVGSTKEYGFNNGIRSMSPDVIATDEIGTKQDIESILKATMCGVNVLATIHAKDINQLKNKRELSEIISKKILKRYVVLSSSQGKGTIEAIFNQDFIKI